MIEWQEINGNYYCDEYLARIVTAQWGFVLYFGAEQNDEFHFATLEEAKAKAKELAEAAT